MPTHAVRSIDAAASASDAAWQYATASPNICPATASATLSR
jgi:hypothetical protein